MKFRVSTASERLVGRLDEGEDLVEVLTRLCDNRDVKAAQIRAAGLFDAVELVYYDSDSGEYRQVVDGEGDFELVNLTGTVSRLGGEVALKLDAMFNVGGPAGPRIVGGQLRAARAVDAEFVIETFPDLQLERRLDDQTGRLVLDEIERRAGAGTGPEEGSEETYSAGGDDQAVGDGGGSMSWDQAIEEADQTEQQRKQRRSSGPAATTKTVGGSSGGTDQEDEADDRYADFDFDEPLMSQGDYLDHPKLGKCKILQVEDDDHVKIRMPRGRVRKLMLKVLEIEYRGEEEGKRVFEARVK